MRTSQKGFQAILPRAKKSLNNSKMDYGNNSGGFRRNNYQGNRGGGYNRGFRPAPQTFQGNWKCSKCGAEITELKFNPTPGKDVLCNSCHSEKVAAMKAERRSSFGGGYGRR